MKISRKWLQQYMDISDLSMEEIAEKITRAGFEVEEIQKIGEGDNLVIGEVLTCEDHPDSDHLHVTTVDTGDEVLQIVCGAPNVAAGQKVIVAKPGAVLPGGQIKKGMIRGQESNGMICALFELGVDKHLLRPEQVAGIEILDADAPVGHTDPLDYLGWRDEVLDISLTPNRSDCMAAFHMAEEIGAILNRKVQLPVLEDSTDMGSETEWKVESRTEGCPLFLGKAIGSVTIKESPRWIQERLRANGVHTINNVVDISNLVMLETGNPMHFYDAAAFPAKEITVMEGFDQPYTALDGVEYKLEPQDLVITTEGRPVGIAGIMGGDDSKILDTTTSLFLECAIFDHVRIRRTSRRLSLNTEASQRYIKGLEMPSAFAAMDRAVALLKEYADAKDIEKTVVCGNPQMKSHTISCTLQGINRRLGTQFELEEVLDVLSRLSFQPEMQGDSIVLTIPAHRKDMEGLADVSEEVIRMLGYDRLESTLPQMPMTEGKLDDRQKMVRSVKNLLVGQGLQETVTYTLVSTEKMEDGILAVPEKVQLATPLSEERRWIRNSLLPSLLERVAYNRAHKASDIRLFEVAALSDMDGITDHQAFALEGNERKTGWHDAGRPVDFYTAKGLVESVLEQLGVNEKMIRFEPNQQDTSHFHPYRSAVVKAGKQTIGIVGQIHPAYADRLDVKDTMMAELDLTAIQELKKTKVKFQPLSKFPAVQRDLALVVNTEVPASKVVDAIRQAGRLDKEEVVKRVEIFDVYEGSHMEEGKKSLAVRLVIQSHKKTLKEEEIASLMEKVLQSLQKYTGAVLR